MCWGGGADWGGGDGQVVMATVRGSQAAVVLFAELARSQTSGFPETLWFNTQTYTSRKVIYCFVFIVTSLNII